MNAFVLRVEKGLETGRQYSFLEADGSVVVGRGQDCDLRLPSIPLHLDISRRHCLLYPRAGAICIRDLGSRNGTWVNGERIGGRTDASEEDRSHHEERELTDGDEIRIGCTVFSFLGVHETEEADSQLVASS